jgi:hypothetical protein
MLKEQPYDKRATFNMNHSAYSHLWLYAWGDNDSRKTNKETKQQPRPSGLIHWARKRVKRRKIWQPKK